MSNNTNSIYYVSTIKQSVPLSSNKTGTISTVGAAVVGVGTLFKTEMPVGSWLIDLAQNELRKVIDVDSDTRATLSSAFTINLAALTVPNVIAAKDATCVAISVSIPTGLADGEINGQTLFNGTGASWAKDPGDNSTHRDLIDPIIIDAVGTSVVVLIMK